MRSIKLLPGITRKVSSGATILVFVAGTFISTGCNKKDAPTPPPQGERLSGFVQNDVSTNDQGTNNGFFWSLYREGGSASITHGSGGNFAISYNNVNDVVGGKGWNPGSARTIGYNVGALSGSYNFVGIYGWTTSPLIEYYVAEKGSMTGGIYVNSVNSDGHSYSFYKSQRVNAPSIIGTATFWQYKDTWGGAPTAQNRSVNMANHINNWRNSGGQGFGNYNYQILALEAWGNKSGYINATAW
ncbi:glycoside hydrolase [Paraflavitalea soli]|uniref:Endo-1,4-beta-xylanase n=1 Tax=Paraflavitalea soli TaxID=2315862 RepID=A0A3B7MFI9_9BACT|nr:glycoside hydrolase family 11 protein [Paraflavitalea soli]AXY73094.1 glycoside hydrolase [Paraflavitalea soli]